MLAPLYMAEISPPEVRGSLNALEQLSIVLGVVLGFWTRNGEIRFFGFLRTLRVSTNPSTLASSIPFFSGPFHPSLLRVPSPPSFPSSYKPSC